MIFRTGMEAVKIVKDAQAQEDKVKAIIKLATPMFNKPIKPDNVKLNLPQAFERSPKHNDVFQISK